MKFSYTEIAIFIFYWTLMQEVNSNLTWPIKRMSYIPGDIVIGGFFPVHGRCTEHLCGKLQDEGLYQLEALIYTVKQINKEAKLLPGVKLGVLAVDSCDSTAYALEQATQFVKGFIARDNARNLESNFVCDDSSLPEYSNGKFDKIVGIVGGYSSWVSIQLANVLRLFRMPQVSYQSTDPTLSDRERYEYFFRTVPHLGHQMEAIAGILSAFDWKYISVVYADTTYGNKGFERLLKFTSDRSICISSQQRVDAFRFSSVDYDNILSNLLKKNATAVVVLGDKQMARSLLSAATRRQIFDRFIWIGSEAWGSRKSVTKGNERVLEGALCISHVIRPLDGFKEYVRGLNLESHKNENPWFPEYWEEKMKCKYEGFDTTPFNQNYSTPCSKDSLISEDIFMQEIPSVQFVRDAVYAIVQALHNMFSEKCHGSFKKCRTFKNIDGRALKNKISEVTFLDENEHEFKFDANGDAPPRYSIINFQRGSDSEEYDWYLVGSYSRDEDNNEELILDKERLKYKTNQTQFPASSCSVPCTMGQIKIILDTDNCCWHCLSCTASQYIDSGRRCKECSRGTLPYDNKTNCVEIPETYMNYSNPLSYGAILFSLVGIVLTGLTSVVVWIHWDTPIIKTSGRELNCLLLFGIALTFLLTFVIISKPSPGSCAAVRFSLGFCYTLCYAAIVAKIRNIATLIEQNIQNQSKKPRHVHVDSPLTFALILVSIEGIINITWLLHDPPDVIHQYPTWKDNVLICKGTDSSRYLVGLIYPFLLTCFSTAYALKTRKSPGGFNEIRLITFTNNATCVIWLAFFPTYILNSSFDIRTATLSFFLNFCCLVQLMSLFVPKVYIAVFKPHKNTEENITCRNDRQFSSLST